MKNLQNSPAGHAPISLISGVRNINRERRAGRSADRYFFIDSLSIRDLITESQPDAVERDAHYAPRNYSYGN